MSGFIGDSGDEPFRASTVSTSSVQRFKLNRIYLALPLALSCTSPSDSSSNSDSAASQETAEAETVDTAETGHSDSSDSNNESLIATEIVAQLSTEIVTVVQVTWETEETTEGYIEFGETTEYGHQTPLSDANTLHSQLILGMPGDTEIHYRVVSTADSASWTSADRTITTGGLPPAVPTFDVSGTSADGYRIFPVIGSWFGVLIVDRKGRVVWYREHAYDDKVSVQARLTVDGQYLVYNSPCHQTMAAKCGSLIWVSLDGTEEHQVSVHQIGHDFTQLSDGTIATIVQEEREFDGDKVWANSVIEINREGETREVWSAWDTLEMPEIDGDLDWTHANAINHSEDEDAYYVGLTRVSTIVKIDRSTGTLNWKMGGEDSDFGFLGDSERFLTHHNFELQDDHLTLFVNGDGSEDKSHIVTYEIDEEDMTVDEVWSYSSDSSPYVYALGDVSQIHEDSLHITYSTAGYFEQLDDEDVVWTLKADLGYAFGYSNFYKSLYP